MAAYLIAEMNWKDSKWLPEYLKAVPGLLQKHGGSYLVQTGESERIEGTREVADALVVIEFPTVEAARAFLDDPEYAAPRAARLAGTYSETILVPGK
jgi:uncharacterized protein (DUF1330 family)